VLIGLSIALLILSHGLYLVPLARAVGKSILPSPIDLVGISAVAYFDLGMILEGCGFQFHSPFFTPFFEAPQSQVMIGVILIAASPWLMRLGSQNGSAGKVETRMSELREGTPRLTFYGLLIAICISCTLIPLSLIALTPRLWESRAVLGERMGPWIIFLSFPMYLLAFYVRLRDAETRLGRCVLVFLLVSATLSTLAVGERTLVLLPSFIILLFGQTFSLRRWTATIGVSVLTTALLLPLFKSAYQESSHSTLNMLADTVGNDFYRVPELAATLRMSSWVGGESVSYPGAGYFYAACMFLPRRVAPFKGESSAQQFTAQIMQQAPTSLSWGFGISAISEAIFNVGVLFTPFVLVAYGAAIGWLTRKTPSWMSLEIPLCLAALWIFGYHLSALLVNFGAMALVGLACERLFTRSAIDGLHRVKEMRG
jgi:hypothetical protein